VKAAAENATKKQKGLCLVCFREDHKRSKDDGNCLASNQSLHRDTDNDPLEEDGNEAESERVSCHWEIRP